MNDSTNNKQYVLYPGHMIAMTGSVFMTVAIAMERYVAVHYPLDYNQVSSIGHATRGFRRLCAKYSWNILQSTCVLSRRYFWIKESVRRARRRGQTRVAAQQKSVRFHGPFYP